MISEIDHVIKLYIKKTKDIESNIDVCIAAIIASNNDNATEKIENLREALLELKSLVLDDRHPTWLTQILSAVINSEKQSPPQRKRIIDALIRHKSALVAHDWAAGTESIFADPDEIYKFYKSQSRLAELAETVSSLLEELLASDELSEKASMNLVQQIKSAVKASETIKSEKTGVTNTGFYIDFLASLGRNIVKANLEALPIVGPTVTGINKAVEEMSIEHDGLMSNVKRDIAKKLPKGIDTPLLVNSTSENYTADETSNLIDGVEEMAESAPSLTFTKTETD